MSIEQQLNDRLKQAMRARDQRMLNLVRMLKSRMTERTTASGFSGTVDDDLWIEVIASYAKSQAKAIDQYKAAGAAGAEHVEQIEWELAATEEWLPKKADEATVRGWVDAAVAGLGGKENAKLGAVMGAVMKAHRADVEPAMVRQLVQEALA